MMYRDLDKIMKSEPVRQMGISRDKILIVEIDDSNVQTCLENSIICVDYCKNRVVT